MRWFETDVSGLPVGVVFKGQAVQRNKLEGRIQFYLGGSIRTCTKVLLSRTLNNKKLVLMFCVKHNCGLIKMYVD
jgi:hypothetical protein